MRQNTTKDRKSFNIAITGIETKEFLEHQKMYSKVIEMEVIEIIEMEKVSERDNRKTYLTIVILVQWLRHMFKVRRDGTATVVEQKEAKDYTFLTNIFDLCIECVEQGEVPKPQVRYSDIFTVHVTLYAMA